MIGTSLGKWVVDKELGRGAMGRVYLAHRAPAASNDHAPELAAVKVLAPHLAQEPGFLDRFQREIDALSQLDHPNIIRFYESGAVGEVSYYAMEYVPSQDCAQLLRDNGRLFWKLVLDLALQVCSALKHAHDHGVIHRDIKPQNLLRSEDGIVKLADFGVAKVFASQQLTSAGSLVGTAEYTSPEQAAGKPVTIRSDLYSFGATLYMLLTGRLPFQGKTALDLLHKHRFSQFDAPRKLVPEIPVELDDIVCALMAKEPADRPANAAVLQRQLEGVRRVTERREQATSIDGAAAEQSEELDFELQPGLAARPPSRKRLPTSDTRRRQPITLGQLLHHPVVLLVLLAACGGLIAWTLWPASAESLYHQGAALMESDDPSDWERAWSKYFERLERRYPDHPYAEQLHGFRERIEDNRAEKQAVKLGVAAKPMSDAQLFYTEGLVLRREGDLLRAQLVWQNTVWAFEGVESEQRWVRLAKKGLAELRQRLPAADQRLALVRQALDRARQLPPEQAERQRHSIEYLYADDPAILQEVNRSRGKTP